MAINTRNIKVGLMVVMAAMFLRGCIGVVHKVGGSRGWALIGVDYVAWAYSRTFRAGDSLVFEYNKTYHDVIEVTLKDFMSCTVPSASLVKYHSGSDMVNLTRTGHYYFICGVSAHCLAGQKLDVHVHSSSSFHVPFHNVSSPPAIAPRAEASSASSPLFPFVFVPFLIHFFVHF